MYTCTHTPSIQEGIREDVITYTNGHTGSKGIESRPPNVHRLNLRTNIFFPNKHKMSAFKGNGKQEAKLQTVPWQSKHHDNATLFIPNQRGPGNTIQIIEGSDNRDS